MMQATFTISGVILDVSFTKSQYRPQTWLEPEEPVEVEIDTVYCNGVDIWELLSDKTLDDLRVEILTDDTRH